MVKYLGILLAVLIVAGSAVLMFHQPISAAYQAPKEVGGVTVYYKTGFDKELGGFDGVHAKLRLTDDAVSGQALQATCLKKWAGPSLSLNIKGSKDLKIAFLAKGENFPLAQINLFDTRAHDNTTSYAYRYLANGRWTPVLYDVDRFHYNSKESGYIRLDASFSGIRLFGPDVSSRTVRLTLDNFVVYRGRDSQPPAMVEDLKSKPGPNGVALSWKPAKDNVGVMLYVVSRSNGDRPFAKIAETFKPAYLDVTAPPGTHRYRVLASDFENNLGPWSPPVSATSTASAGPLALTRQEMDRINYAKHVKAVHRKGVGKVNKGRVCLYGDSLTAPTVYWQSVMSRLGIYKVTARGFGGMRTGWGKANALKKALEPENPEYILILFGTNNVRGQIQKPEVYEKWADDVIAIAKAAESRGTVAVIGTIPPRGFTDPKSEPEAQYNAVLIHRARAEHIPVAYIFKQVQQAGNRRKFIYKDGIHWTVPGMKAAAAAWAKTMAQVQFAVRDRP